MSGPNAREEATNNHKAIGSLNLVLSETIDYAGKSCAMRATQKATLLSICSIPVIYNY